MRNAIAALLFASILVVGAMTGPALYAEGTDDLHGSMMGQGMMGGGHMKGMSRMMGHCADMIQNNGNTGRPNEQWRDGQSRTPDDHN